MPRVMTLAVVLAVISAGPSAAQSAAKKAAPAPAARSFKVEVEQEGKALATKDHEVIVRRAPFALLLTLPEKTGVFVSVSFEPEITETARSGKPFGKADFRSAIAGAEGVANKDHDLMVRTPGTDRLHFWDCSPGDDSRFDQLTPQGAGCRGRRTVDNLFIGDESVALAKLLRRPLHLVFFRGTLSGDGVVKEMGRDWLTLYLDTVPDSQKAAAKGYLESLVDVSRPMDQREAALQGLAGMGRQGIQALDAVTSFTPPTLTTTTPRANLLASTRAGGFLTKTDPVIVTEFGDGGECGSGSDPYGPAISAYVSAVITYADQHNASWTAWAWYPGGCKFPALINDWTGTPTPPGAVVQSSLAGYGQPAPGGKRDAGSLPDAASAAVDGSVGDGGTTGADASKPSADGGSAGDASAGG